MYFIGMVKYQSKYNMIRWNRVIVPIDIQDNETQSIAKWLNKLLERIDASEDCKRLR